MAGPQRWDYERKTLLSKLRTVQPALAKAEAVAVAPIFQNLWFTETGLALCANDQIAMVAVLDEGCPIGGVNGERLIKLIDSDEGERIQLRNGDGRLQVIGTGFNAKLATDPGEPPFRWPDATEAEAITVGDDCLAAFRMARNLVNPLSHSRQACGVTVLRNDDGTTLYATDRSAALRAHLGQPGEACEVILSLPFVKQVVALGGDGQLCLFDDHAVFSNDKAGLWGRTLTAEHDKLDFETVMNKRMPPQLAPVPDGFWAAIERAGIMADDSAEERLVQLAVRKGRLRLETSAQRGMVVDALHFDHPDVTLQFDQKRLAALGKHPLTRMGLTAQTLLFASAEGDLEYMFAAH